MAATQKQSIIYHEPTGCSPDRSPDMQKQTAVTAHLKSKQLLLFAFAFQMSSMGTHQPWAHSHTPSTHHVSRGIPDWTCSHGVSPRDGVGDPAGLLWHSGTGLGFPAASDPVPRPVPPTLSRRLAGAVSLVTMATYSQDCVISLRTDYAVLCRLLSYDCDTSTRGVGHLPRGDTTDHSSPVHTLPTQFFT